MVIILTTIFIVRGSNGDEQTQLYCNCIQYLQFTCMLQINANAITLNVNYEQEM